MSRTEKLRHEAREHLDTALGLAVTDRLSAMVKMNVILWTADEFLGAFRWAREPTSVADAFEYMDDLKKIIERLEHSLIAAHEAWDLVTVHMMKVAPQVFETMIRQARPDERILT